MDITWRRGNPLIGATVTALPGDEQSINLTYPQKQSQVPQFGHHLWFRDGSRPDAGVLAQYSTHVTFSNIAMYFMGGFGIVSQFTQDLTLSNVSAETSPDSGRCCSCAADLLHFSGCAGLINITGGRFVGIQDDGVNIHGTHLQIMSQPSPTQTIVQFMQHESYGFGAFFAEGEVQFTRSDTLESFGAGIVKRAKMLSATGCAAAPNVSLPCQQLLELEKPTIGARLKMDVIENTGWTPDVSIVGNFFNRIPTRGMLVTTRGKVRISNNTIHTNLNAALHFADDAASWYESGPVSDVEFSGNVVIQRQHGSCQSDHTAIDVAPSNKKHATVHRNLRILNNDIYLHHGSKLAVLAVKSIAGVTLSGNWIFTQGRPMTPAQLVTSVNCSDIAAYNNTVITASGRPQKSDGAI